MIRHPHGNEFFLISQHDHALLSGRLAAHVGNDRFAPPQPRDAVVESVGMHDSGWPLHDAQPTLNDKHLPLHVFETPPVISTRVWGESVRLAAEKGDYQGLLVSLHVLALSILSQSHGAGRGPRDLFELNKFQHRQVELQEGFRQRLGMRTDRPLQYGLSPSGSGEDEDRLCFNFHLLQAMDRVSLAVCCAGETFAAIDRFVPRPGAAPVRLQVCYPGEFAVALDPWPFDVSAIEADVPSRRVPAVRFDDEEHFRRVYADAPVEIVRARVCAG